MKQSTAIWSLAGVIVTALASFSAGRYIAGDPVRCGDAAMRLNALARANEIEGAVSALDLIAKNDLMSAQTILRGQVLSSLTVLKATSHGDLQPPEAQLIEEAQRKGKEFLQAHPVR